MYLINQEEPAHYPFVQNEELNREICSDVGLFYDGIESEEIAWVTYEERSGFWLATSDSSLAGLYELSRVDGACEEQFKLSMCYLDIPPQITVSSDQVIFYVDTAATLASGAEIGTIEISHLAITPIPDPSAVQCEFTVTVETTYPGSVAFAAPLLEIEVMPEYEVGTYEATLRTEVAEVGWSQDLSIYFDLQQKL